MPNFVWTPEMGPAPIADHLDAQARAATVAAVTFLDPYRPGVVGEAPAWNIGTFVRPANATGEAMQAAILAHVTATGIDRARILACAVQLAVVAHDAGGGAAGWKAMAAMLPTAASARSKVVIARQRKVDAAKQG